MKHRLYWIVFIVFFLFNRYEATRNGIPHILSQLFQNQSKPPIVLYIDSIPNIKEDTRLSIRDLEDVDRFHLRTSQNDDRAYILYHLLRTTLENEDIEPSAAENLEYTKGLLRQAFRSRCKKLDRCINKCPPKKTCKKSCKQIFDDLNACDEPKKNICKKPKCGKTMPPSWLIK